MTRESLDRRLNNLRDEILLLGSMVEQAVLNSVDALKRQDTGTAAKIIENDQEINDRRFAIENALILLFATQQPVATDLRLLASMLEITTELERMGDYAKGIGKVVVHLGNKDLPLPSRELSRMADLGVSMLHRALSAFIENNVNQSRRIPMEDDEVDGLYNKVYHLMVEVMVTKPDQVDDANQIMWVAHNLERFADRVSNICERTVFIATGELLELNSTAEEEEDEEESGG